MKPAPRRWRVADLAPLDGLPPILGRVLAARGLDAGTAASLVDPDSSAECLHDPFRLPDMVEAVIAIGIAVRGGMPIAIYGDYDVDGVTACAMLTRALRAGGAEVVPYIPNRMAEGYGLHGAALAELGSRGVGCVVTVDCGTSSVDAAAGRPQGMRLVVTDHHLPLAAGGGPPALAPADALVNPKRPDSVYPFDALAGAGVAWKLLCALEAERLVPPGSSDEALGLAALGTVADMMPLRGENRAIVAAGLPRLSQAPSPGIRALVEAAGLAATLRTSDLAFAIGPRINAAGRMEDAVVALTLLLAEDPDEARGLADTLCAQNRERQAAVARALAEAEQRVAALPDDLPAIVLGDPGWPMGIVGLVAGRIAERYGRPTAIACLEGEEGKGSVRAACGVHVVRALDQAAGELIRYGGHAAAAGFSVDPARFAAFAERFGGACAAQLGDAPRERPFRIDAAVDAVDLTPSLCTELAALEPCGQGNPEPTFALLDAQVLGTTAFGTEGQHVRIALGGSDGGVVEAIAFNKPGLGAHLPRGRRIDVCFGVELDTWQGFDRVRLRLRDLRPAQPAERHAGSARQPVAGAA